MRTPTRLCSPDAPSRRCLLLAGAALVVRPGAALAASDTTVVVRRDGDTFLVEAALHAPVPLDIAWEVLTDFENMEKFVPNLAASRIIRREGNRLTIAQRGTARFGPLVFAFGSERLVEMAPRYEIRSTQVRGNMRRMESVTRFDAVDDATDLSYRVEVEPGAFFPAAITERFLAHEVREQFDAIVAEMLRRRAMRAP